MDAVDVAVCLILAGVGVLAQAGLMVLNNRPSGRRR